ERRLVPEAPFPADGPAPWPGRLPSPSPAVITASGAPVELLDAKGDVVSVNGRGLLSAAPASLSVRGSSPARVTSWAGPWVVDERWWDGDRRRRVARMQVCTDDGVGRLLALEAGSWSIE